MSNHGTWEPLLDSATPDRSEWSTLKSAGVYQLEGRSLALLRLRS
jgi:hypothetical protein